MDCRSCGAYLDLPADGKGVAQCQYCGTETLVQPPQGPPPQAGPGIPQPMSPQQIQAQLQGQQQWAQQQQQWAHHRAQQQAAHIQRTSKSVGIIIAVSAILPLVT